ncbi:uncharacterized protein LOC142962435 [Anarhichas minor]|uniref:uncharacterized protein LOC142962435 n=1 Tax=Anarhichas minor TaxID=65739 RepID=UPI003F736E7C
MDDKRYQSLLMMLFVITNEFRSFMEHRPGLTEDMNMHDLQTGLTHKQRLDLDSWILNDLDQLTELEEQSVALEEDLRRTMTEISRSQRGMSRWLRHVSRLHRHLKILQEELRATIEILEGRSARKYRCCFFSRRKSMLESQVRERCPLRFQSCPNIPSEALLKDSKLHCLNKWSSLSRTIRFKDSLKDIIKGFDDNVESLEISCKSIMNKLERTWHIDFHQSQQLTPGPGHRDQDNTTLPSSQAAGQDLRSEFQPSTSHSSRAGETARNATSHHSDQSVRHQIFMGIGHSGTSAQQDNESHSTRVREEMRKKAPTTAVKTVVAESIGSPSVSLANISTAIYKTMAASCAAIFIFL